MESDEYIIDFSYNDVKCGKPIYAMSHRTMQVVGESINFIKTSFALRIVAKNCPLGHRIKCFSSALDVKIRKVYSLLYYFAVPVGNTIRLLITSL